MITPEQKKIIISYCSKYGKLRYIESNKYPIRYANIFDTIYITEYNIPGTICYIKYPTGLATDCNNVISYQYHDEVINVVFDFNSEDKFISWKNSTIKLESLNDTTINELVKYCQNYVDE